jgi:hypothetical protein
MDYNLNQIDFDDSDFITRAAKTATWSEHNTPETSATQKAFCFVLNLATLLVVFEGQRPHKYPLCGIFQKLRIGVKMVGQLQVTNSYSSMQGFFHCLSKLWNASFRDGCPICRVTSGSNPHLLKNSRTSLFKCCSFLNLLP